MIIRNVTSTDAAHYARIKRVLLLCEVALTTSFFIIFQLSGLSHAIKSFSQSISPIFYIINGLYVVVFILFMTVLFLPLNYYRHFHLEHRFNLSNQTLKGWLWDATKSLALNLVFSILVVEVIYSFLKNFEHTWWLFSTGFYFFFTVILSRVTPTLLLPLFFKLKPLEDPDLTERLKRLASRVGARILGVFQMDMSRKTKKANAMFAGLGKTKRIILGDTLLAHYTPDEIESVLAHELGHYHYKHMWRFIISGIFTSLLSFFLVHKILGALAAPLGLSAISDIAGLPIFALVLFLFFLLLMPFQNGYSRRLERQADRFALKETRNPEAFINTMKKLGEQNLSEIEPHPWVEWLLYDHPSIAKRIKMAIEYKSKIQNAKFQKD